MRLADVPGLFRKWCSWYEILLLLGVTSIVVLRLAQRERDLDEGVLHRPLVVGITQWPGYAAGIVANNGMYPTMDSLFWSGQGDVHAERDRLLVRFVLVDDPDSGFVALNKGGDKGGLDVMWTTIDAWARQLPKLDFKAKAIMQVDWSHGGDAIIAREEIRRIEDLRGKKVILPKYGPSRWLLESALRHSGLREDNPALRAIRGSIVATKTPLDAKNSFLDGSTFDAAVLWEPYVELAKSRVPNVIFSSRNATNVIADILVAKQDFIEGSPSGKALQVFVRRWLGPGLKESSEKKYTAVHLWKSYMPDFNLDESLDESKVGEMLESVLLTGEGDNLAMFAPEDGHPAFDRLFSRAGKLWKEQGFIDSIVDPSQARDPRFIKALGKKWRESHAPPSCESDRDVSRPRLLVDFVPGQRQVATKDLSQVEQQVREILEDGTGEWFCLIGGVDFSGDDARDASLSQQRAKELHTLLKRSLDMGRVMVRSYTSQDRLRTEESGCSAASCPTVLRILRAEGEDQQHE